MWQIILRTADLHPHRIDIEEGKTDIGRAQTNKIIVDDLAASRHHAQILVSKSAGTISVVDLNSTNGTYLNSKRISKPENLKHGDVIRIGQALLTIQSPVWESSVSKTRSHSYTRELVLESMDQHAIVLYEVARKLNPLRDLDTAITQIVRIISNAMNVGVCQVILQDNFSTLSTLDINQELARKAIQNLSAEIDVNEMYVPVVLEHEILALIYIKKSAIDTYSFGRNDLQLAIAISHQVSLTLHRLRAIKQMHEVESIKQILMRFFAPLNAEKLVETYKKTGVLPELEEQKVTVLFADIVGSTRMAEKLGTSLFATVLSVYYETVTEIIFRHNGIVKYLGDGVLAIFPKVNIKNHEREAVMAARELIASIMQTGYLEDGRKTVIGISINTGNAMLGYVGTKERAEFNVLGDVVNVAFHLQEFARPNKIIIASTTFAALNDDFQTKRVGRVNLKGRKESIQVFEVFP